MSVVCRARGRRAHTRAQEPSQERCERCAFARDVDTVDAIALDGSNALDREFERGEARESNVSDF